VSLVGADEEGLRSLRVALERAADDIEVERITLGRLAGGGHVRVSVSADGSTLALTYEPAQLPAVPA